MYKLLIRPLLFLLPAEKAHHTTFGILRFLFQIPGLPSLFRMLYGSKRQKPVHLMGLDFPNRIGLAAGFDKDAKMMDVFAALGFGFIEIGTLTPRPQSGNEKPRLFRLPKDASLINRMGFNNEGVDAAVERLKKRPKGIIIGGNIGKNKTTPNEKAHEDYAYCFEKLFPYVDYFVVNVSSPNTPGLRDLQEKEPLLKLLLKLQELNHAKDISKPILLKIAPDLSPSQLDDVLEIVEKSEIQGLIATNTTVSRSGLTTSASEIERIGNGGLSGQALTKKSTALISYLKANARNPDMLIIGVGGVHNPETAQEKHQVGAQLIQIYTGLIYEGPSLPARLAKALAN